MNPPPLDSGPVPAGADHQPADTREKIVGAKPLPPRRSSSSARAARGPCDNDAPKVSAARKSSPPAARQSEASARLARQDGSGADQKNDDTLHDFVGAEFSLAGSEAGHEAVEPQTDLASLDVSPIVTRTGRAEKKALAARIAAMDLPTVVDGLVSLHREHRALQKAAGDMTRRIKADERWAAHARHVREGIEIKKGKMAEANEADVAFIKNIRHRLYTAREALEALRRQVQAEQLLLVTRLPVYDWALGVKGFGLPSLAAIIGEAGDIGKYGNPAKFWKRMGLAVIDGERQRKVANDPEKAERHGFRPQRRAEVHVIGENLIRSRNPEYTALYQARKEYELGREEVKFPIVAHKRALRYAEKRLLKHLWSAWRVGTGVAVCAEEEETAERVQTCIGVSPPHPISLPTAGPQNELNTYESVPAVGASAPLSKAAKPRVQVGAPAEHLEDA